MGYVLPTYSLKITFNKKSSITLKAENGVSMEMLTNHHQIGESLGKMVQKYLDEEWIELPIHERIGDLISIMYCSAREDGVTDVGEFLTRTGTALEKEDLSEAFVGPWDVANKVADFLMYKMDRELSSCSGTPAKFDVDINHNNNDNNDFVVNTVTGIDNVLSPLGLGDYGHAMESLETEFSRYKLLKDFIDGNGRGWEDLSFAVSAILGYRLNGKSGSSSSSEIHSVVNILDNCTRDISLGPVDWEDFDSIPDLTNNSLRQTMLTRMMVDMPEDESSTDIAIDSLAGMEMHKIIKRGKDQNAKDKILLCKWLYIYDFLGGEFPPTKRYTPWHLREWGDDEE